MKEEHKFDKYGCIDANCKEHYPIISRETIINEIESTKEVWNDTFTFDNGTVLPWRTRKALNIEHMTYAELKELLK